ncbi:hypothetical protein GETHED_00920 [Geothrix edaphica]|uniref:Uncharacterized protein n=1 Tax=Geothrix edaphica TaxID=2927976 RepID=A0ABQ5PTS7_9BACT|nr:hypothetical protein GETHED_00920 [Geothrix edaphica]
MERTDASLSFHEDLPGSSFSEQFLLVLIPEDVPHGLEAVRKPKALGSLLRWGTRLNRMVELLFIS